MNLIETKQHGDMLRPNARCPIQFRGDWKRVLEKSEIEVMLNDETVTKYQIKWCEGPLWLPTPTSSSDDDDTSYHFYFTDPTLGKIFRLDSSNYKVDVWAIHTGGIDPTTRPELAEPGSNGMAICISPPTTSTTSSDKKRKRDNTSSSPIVAICRHATHSIVTCCLGEHEMGRPLHEAPKFEIVCDSYMGKPLNSPNDVIVDPRDGSIWFTDPIYGLLQKSKFCDEWKDGTSYLDDESCKRRQGIKGVYRVDRHTKDVTLVTSYHRRPNGLAFSFNYKKKKKQKQNQTLWIADSTIGMPSWTEYETTITDTCTSDSQDQQQPLLGSRAIKVLNAATLGCHLGSPSGLGNDMTGIEGLSDGFKIDNDCCGYIWTSIPNGFAVLDPGDDDSDRRPPQVICEIILGVNTSNVAFGSNGDVWLTGAASVWRLKRRVP